MVAEPSIGALQEEQIATVDSGVRLSAIRPLGRSVTPGGKRLLYAVEDGLLDKRGVLPLGDYSAALSSAIGDLAGVADVGENLADAQPVEGVALSAPQINASCPLAHLPQRVATCRVSVERLTDERCRGWVEDDLPRLLSPVADR